MKVSNADLATMRAAIIPLDTEVNRTNYRTGNFERADKVKDLDVRYRWDLFYAAGSFRLFEGEYNDTHLDTALRSIVPAF